MNALTSYQLLHHYRSLSDRPLTVVDVETTGHLPHCHRVIEVAIVQGRVREGISRCRSDLINAGSQVPPYISHLTGISQEMVDAATVAETVWPSYAEPLHQGILTAHNLEFDYGFLQAEYRRLGTRFSRPLVERFCTVKLARLMLAHLPSRSLPQLVQHFKFDVGRSHRAEADARACWLLAQRLLTDICHEPDEVILHRFAQEWIPINMAARLLKRSRTSARSQLEQAGIPYRLSQSKQNPVPMYRRGDVETLILDSDHLDSDHLDSDHHQPSLF